MSRNISPPSLPAPPLLDRLCCPVCLHDQGHEASLRAEPGRLTCERCGAAYEVRGSLPDLRAPIRDERSEDELDQSARLFYEKVYQEGSYGRDVQEEHLEPLRALLGGLAATAFVLELGPGRGALQGLHPGYAATDLSVHALAQHVRTPAFSSDIQRLPLRSGTVDFLYTVAVLEHVPRPELALREIARVLAPGGCAYLAPAWNCRPWAAEGLHVRPFRDLTFTQKLRKLTIPLRDSLVWRGLFAIPRRLARRASWRLGRRPTAFRYRRLQANFEVFWASDSDATASLDPHEAALYFQSRGFAVDEPRGPWRAIFHRAQPVVVRRPRDLDTPSARP
jgi:SAM-dependent methyltransferase